jgi:hypothetical protein
MERKEEKSHKRRGGGGARPERREMERMTKELIERSVGMLLEEEMGVGRQYGVRVMIGREHKCRVETMTKEDKCELRSFRAVGIYPVWARQEEEEMAEENKEVLRELKRKSEEEWGKREPLHVCVQREEKEGKRCDEKGGMGHAEEFERMLRGKRVGEEGKVTYLHPTSIEGEEREWREGSVQVPVRMEERTYRDFGGNRGLKLTVVGLSVLRVYYCRRGGRKQGAHNCARLTCARMVPQGGLTCTLTGEQIMEDGSMMEEGWRGEKSGEWAWAQRSAHELYQAGFDQPQGTGGQGRASLLAEPQAFQEALEGAESAVELAGLRTLTYAQPGRRSAGERREREERRRALLAQRDAASRRLAANGRWSTQADYRNVAQMRIKDLIGFGGYAQKGTVRYLRRMWGALEELRAGKEGREVRRIQVALKPKEGKGGGGGEEEAIEPFVDAEDRLCFVFREAEIRQRIDVQIRRLADAALRFWIIIRTRTQRGRGSPHLFPFNNFVVAFLYLLKEGLSFPAPSPSEAALAFFEKNAFLGYVLPPFGTLPYLSSSFSPRDLLKSKQNIVDLLVHELLDSATHPSTLCPFRALLSPTHDPLNQTHSPSLFLGLRLPRFRSR